MHDRVFLPRHQKHVHFEGISFYNNKIYNILRYVLENKPRHLRESKTER